MTEPRVAGRGFHRARRAAGLFLLAAFLALPFLRIGGESALRFDLPSLRMHLFGATIWMQDFFLILIAAFALVFAAIFLTIRLGRVWCGWACPQTVLVDLTWLPRLASRRPRLEFLIRAAAGTLLGAAVAAATVCYFVSPYELLPLLRAGGAPATLVTGTWAVIALLIALDLILVRRRFCARICPYAKLQGVLFDDRTLVVAFDEGRAGECMKCAACVKACPMDVDIRDGAQVECIHCAECVDACTERMGRRGLPSLVRYSRGYKPVLRGGLRVAPLVTGLLSLAFVALLALLLAGRPPFEATIRPVDPAGAFLTGGGAIAVPCVLSLRNLSRSGLEIALEASSPAGSVLVSRRVLALPAGPEALKAKVTLVIEGVADASRPIQVNVILSSAEPAHSSRETFAVMPRPRK